MTANLADGSTLAGVGAWARSGGLEIVLFVIGAMLFSRFAQFVRDRIIRRIDAGFQGSDSLVRSEAAKHRHALAQVVTWVLLSIVYFLVALEVLQRLGFPLGGLVAPAAVIGAALGFGARRLR